MMNEQIKACRFAQFGLFQLKKKFVDRDVKRFGVIVYIIFEGSQRIFVIQVVGKKGKDATINKCVPNLYTKNTNKSTQ